MKGSDSIFDCVNLLQKINLNCGGLYIKFPVYKFFLCFLDNI